MKAASILSVLVLMIAGSTASAYGRNYCSIRKPTAFQRMMCQQQRRGEGGHDSGRGNRGGRGGHGGDNCGKGGNRGGDHGGRGDGGGRGRG